jgi:RNA polymerase sigma-70 factor (ECF subfamily)
MTSVLPDTRSPADTARSAAAHPDAAHSDAAHSDAVLRDLYRDHATALLRYAQWFTDDPAAAEDAVQETFLRAWRHLPRLLADGRPPRPWLRRVLRHVMIDVGRAARAHRETPHDTPPVDGEVDGGFESLLDRAVLGDALRALSPAHREVLVDVYYRDATTERVAARLGVPTGTVRSRLHYALRAVRRQLDVPADVPRPV